MYFFVLIETGQLNPFQCSYNALRIADSANSIFSCEAGSDDPFPSVRGSPDRKSDSRWRRLL